MVLKAQSSAEGNHDVLGVASAKVTDLITGRETCSQDQSTIKSIAEGDAPVYTLTARSDILADAQHGLLL